MKITDNRTITVEIDGVEHKLTLEDAQHLHDGLSGVIGIRPPLTRPHWNPGYQIRYADGGNLTPSAIANAISVRTTARSVA